MCIYPAQKTWFFPCFFQINIQTGPGKLSTFTPSRANGPNQDAKLLYRDPIPVVHGFLKSMDLSTQSHWMYWSPSSPVWMAKFRENSWNGFSFWVV